MRGNLQAEVLSKTGTKYQLPIGARVRLVEEGTGNVFEWNFAGRALGLEPGNEGFVFFDWENKLERIFPPEKIRITALGTGTTLAQGDLAPVVKGRVQQGPTCGATNFFNGCRQMYLLGFKGNGTLAQKFSTEGGRFDLISELLSKMHIEAQHSVNMPEVIKKKVEEYGLVVTVTSGKTLPKDVKKNLELGQPVILRFDCPKDACELPYTIFDDVNKTSGSASLFMPVKKGEKVNGGHAVLLSGIFKGPDGKQMIVVNDPNFQWPRLWPAENLNSPILSKLRAWTFWEPLPKKVAPEADATSALVQSPK